MWLSSTSPTREVYASDEVDAFYVIDGDLTHYWIPQARVAGFQAVALTAYPDCVLPFAPVRTAAHGATWPESGSTCSEEVSTASNADAGMVLRSSTSSSGQSGCCSPWKNHGDPLSASTRP